MRKLVVTMVPVLALLSGCVIYDQNLQRTLVAQPAPGEKSAIVSATAWARCSDYFLFQRCWLDLMLRDEAGHAAGSGPTR